jgi:uncharacterized protein (DUF1330 family)
MSAYIVFTKEKTRDPAELAIYQRQVPRTLEPFDVRRLVTNGLLEVLEGEPVEGVVITEFPTMEAAKAWYDSPAYRDARVHRQKGAEYRCLIVDGL